MAVSHVFSNAVADATGTLTVWFGATTATVAATDIVRPQDWNSAHNQFITLGGNTAGQSTVSGTNVVFAGGNNVTLSANGSTISIVGGAGGGGAAISGGASSQSTGTVIFSNSNGVSFGLNAGTMTASHNGLTSQSNQAVSAANGQSTFQTLSFADSNGVSWLTNANGLVATVRTDYQSSNANYLTSQSNQAFSADASSTFQTLVFQDSNGVSFSNNAGSLRVTHGLQFTSNTSNIITGRAGTGTSVTGLASITLNTNGLAFNGTGLAGTGTTFNGANISGSMTVNTAGVNLSMSVAAPGGGGNFSAGVSGGNTSNTSGVTGTRVVFAGGNNITLSQSNDANGASITISGANVAAGNVTFSAGTTSGGLGAVTFANSNGVSFGLNAGVITATVRTDYLTTQSAQAFSADASSTFQTLVFQDSNGVSFSNNAGSLRVTHALQFTSNTSAITSNALNTSASRVINIIAATNNTGGGTASLSSNVSFSAANGLTFYTSAGNAIVGSYTQSNQAFSAGGASSAFQTLVFQDSNGLSFSNNAGSIRVSYTRNVVSNAIQSVGSATNSGTNTSRFAADDHVHAGVFSMGVSNDAGNSAGDTRVDVGRFVLRGGNNITLSQITAANALNTIVVSGGAGGGGGAAISAGANSQNTGTVNFANSNNVTFGLSNNGTMTADVRLAASNSAGSFTFQTLNFSNANNVTFGTSAGGVITASVAAPGAAAENNWMTLLGANVSGNSSASGSTIGLSGVNLTLSGTNGSQIVFSAPATSSLALVSGLTASTNGSTISIYPVAESYKAYGGQFWVNTQTYSVAQSTSIVWPLDFQNIESVGFLRMPQTVAMTSMASLATTANTTISSGQTHTYHMGIYTRGVGASSLSMQSVATTTWSTGQSMNFAANANGSQYTVSHGFSWQMSTGQSTFSTSYAASVTNFQISTTHLTRFTGPKFIFCNWNTVFLPERYNIAFGVSTSLATQAAASFSNGGRINTSGYGLSQVNLGSWGEFGNASTASNNLVYGNGSFTTNAIGTTASIPFANVSTSASHIVPYITFARIA